MMLHVIIKIGCTMVYPSIRQNDSIGERFVAWCAHGMANGNWVGPKMFQWIITIFPIELAMCIYIYNFEIFLDKANCLSLGHRVGNRPPHDPRKSPGATNDEPCEWQADAECWVVLDHWSMARTNMGCRWVDKFWLYVQPGKALYGHAMACRKALNEVVIGVSSHQWFSVRVLRPISTMHDVTSMPGQWQTTHSLFPVRISQPKRNGLSSYWNMIIHIGVRRIKYVEYLHNKSCGSSSLLIYNFTMNINGYWLQYLCE
jgi:hypothetical protein